MGGYFTSLAPNGGSAIPRKRIARLNTDGSVDTTFDPSANDEVLALALQPDGKLVIGGLFTSLSPNGGSAIPRNHIARLNADGSVDATFNPNANGIVFALALQPDGKLVLGGVFTSLSPNGGSAITRNRMARLNADGSLDTAFDPNPDAEVYALALQPDGKLVLGGLFFSLSPQGGGAIARSHIARLNAEGSLDTAFNPSVRGNVYALALQPDGKLVASGQFTAIGAVVRNSIARLNTPQAALQSVNIVGYTTGSSTITWTREGGGPELALPPRLTLPLNSVSHTRDHKLACLD